MTEQKEELQQQDITTELVETAEETTDITNITDEITLQTLLKSYSPFKEQTTSIDVSTITGKMKLYNGLTSADCLVKDCLGEVIELKDFIVSPYVFKNKDTNELYVKYRTLLISAAGKSYISTSTKFATSLANIFDIFGQPNLWEKPLKLKFVNRPASVAGHQYLDIKIVG